MILLGGPILQVYKILYHGEGTPISTKLTGVASKLEQKLMADDSCHHRRKCTMVPVCVSSACIFQYTLLRECVSSVALRHCSEPDTLTPQAEPNMLTTQASGSPKETTQELAP